MRDERPKTEKEENLDEIIEYTDAARRCLEKASDVAESSGDRDGADEIDKVAVAVEKIDSKYKGIRDKKSG
jgi:hypothetical protein